MNKAIVLFTTFWDANSLMECRNFLVRSYDKQKISKINLLFDESDHPKNFCVHSIALSNPPLEKISQLHGLYEKGNLTRLDFLCPTYNILKRYKNNKDWESYLNDFIDLLKTRKDEIKDWILSLASNNLYILCCWENTSNGAHCHRKIIYDHFIKSKFIQSKIICLYRHGSEIKKSRVNNEGVSQENQQENSFYQSLNARSLPF